MAKFNERLRGLRLKADLSQQELAAALGTTKSSINMYERGEREPGFEKLYAIAQFFGVDMNYLFGFKEECMEGNKKAVINITVETDTKEVAALAEKIREDGCRLVVCKEIRAPYEKEVTYAPLFYLPVEIPNTKEEEKMKGVIASADFGRDIETPVGLLTPFRDRNGKRLVTGDVVRVYDQNGDALEELAFVTRKEPEPKEEMSKAAKRAKALYELFQTAFVLSGTLSAEAIESEGFFVCGLSGSCDNNTGKFLHGFSVEKVRRYTELKDGEQFIGGIYRARSK